MAGDQYAVELEGIVVTQRRSKLRQGRIEERTAEGSELVRKVVRKTTLEEQPTDFAYGEDNLTKRDWLRSKRSDKNTISGVMILSPDFKDFFASLNGARVRYLVVGGYAVALHGHPRYTKDLDIWVGLDEKNARCLVQAIEDFGFGARPGSR